MLASANPTITVQGTVQPGSTVTLHVDNLPQASQYFATFISGLNPIFVPIYPDSNGDFSVEIPPSLLGVSFLVITNDGTKSDDTVTLAGPTFLDFPFDENEQLIIS
jgi:hypothetical protein